MFRRIFLSAIVGLGLVAGLGFSVGTADAHPPLERFHHRYAVIVLRHGCWEDYGCGYDRFEAERIAHRLRFEGHPAEIRLR
jgi:hypothetical protein